MFAVAVMVPEIVEAVVDRSTAGPAEQMADHHAMDHAGSRMDAADRIAAAERIAQVVGNRRTRPLG